MSQIVLTQNTFDGISQTAGLIIYPGCPASVLPALQVFPGSRSSARAGIRCKSRLRENMICIHHIHRCKFSGSIGLDLTPAMIEQARKKNLKNSTFVVGDCENLSFEADTFDAIISP